jgi:hypothetical protein
MFIKIHISIICIIILCIFWMWYMTACLPNLLRHCYKEIDFKTGDMILFHAWDNINPIFIGCFWGHVGIVYNDPENSDPPLLFEAAATNNINQLDGFNKNGIMVTDLKSRLEKYPGLISCKILDKSVDHDISKGLYEFMVYARNNMHYNHNVFTNGFNKLNGELINNSVNCGELTGLCLVKLGLVSIDTLYRKKPHHLLYVCKLYKLINNKYRTPIEITFNPF